jgi:hypothetical protein
MAQAQQLAAEGPGSGDVTGAVLGSISGALVPRGYLTTEWWTTILGGALSAVLALVHVGGTTATHVAAVIAPAVLAALYAITRTMHKSQLASLLSDVFPQAAAVEAAAAPVAAPAAGPAAGPAGAEVMAASAPEDGSGGEPTAAGAQTDPGFSFQGIPPIEDASDAAPAAAEGEAPPAAPAEDPAVAEAMPASAPEAAPGSEPTAAGAQTDPDFSFQGIPPIEDDNG